MHTQEMVPCFFVRLVCVIYKNKCIFVDVIYDEVEVTIAPDTAERSVEVPPELASALDADPEARAAFEKLAYTRRKELARGVAEAKRTETKERRVAAALGELRRP